MTTKTTVEWFNQLAENSEGVEEKREAMTTAFSLACRGATVPPSMAIRARIAMNRADTRDEYKAAHAAIRASGE